MDDLDSTGMQNPIFNIMGSESPYPEDFEYELMFKYGYEIIKYFYRTNNGQLFLIKEKKDNNEKIDNLYFLHKINLTSKEMKSQIEIDLNNLSYINSEYILKYIKYFFVNENKEESICIIFNYYENDLKKLIHQTNFFNSRNSWKIFIQLLLGLNSLSMNNIFLNYICPQNIFLDNKNNIKISGFHYCLDFKPNNSNETILPYLSQEILKKVNVDEKSCIWSLGCILYELSFKSLAFSNQDNKNLEKDILSIKYNSPIDCDKDISIILTKLICERQKRLTLKELLLDEIIKNKIIELNMFPEVLGDNSNSKYLFFNLLFQILIVIFPLIKGFLMQKML